MDLKKTSTAYAGTPRSAVLKLFWTWPKSEFGEHLASKFVFIAAIYSFLKYLRCRQTQTSSGCVENVQRRFGSPRRHPFL